MPRRGWQTVEVPAGWFEVIRDRASQVGDLAQGTAQRFSSFSARSWGRSSAEAQRSPTVSSCQQREAHSRRYGSGRTRTRGEVGSRHPCRWRVGSYFPGAPRGSQTSTAACTGATSGEPDQAFGVLHRAGEEARGESTQGGGGCEGQSCRRRIDIDFVHCRMENSVMQPSWWKHRGQKSSHHPRCPWISKLQLRSLVVELQREREELRSELGSEVLPHQPRRVAHGQFGRCPHQLPI